VADHGLNLAGRRVLVTGGSSGIGLTVAEQLSQAGARVVLLARGEAGLAEAAGRVSGCAGTIAADVRDPTAMAAALDQAAGLLGGLDAVVANAGAGAYGPFVEMAPDDVQATVAITLLGTLNTAQAAIGHLERTAGTLVVVGSVAGRLPTPWLAAYAAAKHGVRGFVRSLQCELIAQRKPVRVALIAPGPVDTPFWRRARTPDRRMPPELRGAYRAETVASEVLRALGRPGPTERTVGGLMALPIALDALFPNRVLAPLGMLARLAWRARSRQPPSTDDALAQPTEEAHAGGGLVSRPSALQWLRHARS
jgi:NAD(P)-dependent dehydrogenase (short-subunit alcohol dehydrogenase family)